MSKKAWAGCGVLLLVAGCVQPHAVQESGGAATPGVQPSPAAPGAATEATNAAPPSSAGTGPVVPAPPTQTVQPGQTAQPAEKPARGTPPSAGSRAAPTAGTSAGGASAAKSPARPSGPAVPVAPAPPAVPASPALDLTSLEQRLRDTHAIGLFTKLSLKNQVDDLLAQFRAFHRGQSAITPATLRQRFELLLLKVVSLLQDGDARLAAAVSSSREAIWAVLVDPVKFAQL